MKSDKIDNFCVTPETLKQWAEKSTAILKAKDSGAIDPANPFVKAQIDWAQMSEEEKIDFVSQNKFAIQRWQSETDAMTKDELLD